MPRETVDVLISAPPAEAMSQLMSYVAYPDAFDASERNRFARALWRMAILHKASSDEPWGAKPQLIRPAMLIDDEKTVLDALGRGMDRLHKHLATAHTFLIPHFIQNDTGRLPYLSEINRSFEKQKPTVENTSLAIKKVLGWQGDDVSTFKNKIWRITKPVAHLGYAIALWHNSEMRLAELRGKQTSEVFFDLFFDSGFPTFSALQSPAELRSQTSDNFGSRKLILSNSKPYKRRLYPSRNEIAVAAPLGPRAEGVCPGSEAI